MKFGFVTCVKLGLSCMKEIERQHGRLDLIVTLEDSMAKNKSGRVYLDDFSNSHGAELMKIKNINDPAVVEKIKELNIDWLLIIGWSQIAKNEVLSAPNKGVIGMHPTLLPKGRGRASIPWAILKKLPKTGVTMFKLDDGVDTGPIITQKTIPIENTETATTLYQKVNDCHIEIFKDVWPKLVANKIKPTPQNNSSATYWEGRTPKDGEIKPESMSSEEVDTLVRATTKPYPGAFLVTENGILRIWAGRTLNDNSTRTPNYTFKTTDGYYEVLDFSEENS